MATGFKDPRGKYVGPQLRGALEVLMLSNSRANLTYFGATAVASVAGGVQVSIAAPLVAADSLVRVTPVITGVTSAAPAFQLAVMSIQAGSGFIYGSVGSFSYTGSFTVTAMWEILGSR